ncbi:TerB family tellurite resistance protein [Brucella sp. 21LCYQ03]|nr:TerB family tellurite resistance protein [Brucella sp. 21LCYQ03]
MFDRLLDFLKELPGNSLREGLRTRDEKFSDDDPRLAAGALMFHIMDADGDAREVERAKLSAMLSQKYGLKGDALKKLIRAAEEADQESINLSDFTSVLKRHLDYQARLDFIILMWNIVYSDGIASEVEVNVMWRIADLIGIKSAERDQIESQARSANSPVHEA